MRKLLIACLALLVATGAWGQGKSKTGAWAQEPDSFIGIKFREPFPVSFDTIDTSKAFLTDLSLEKKRESEGVKATEKAASKL